MFATWLSPRPGTCYTPKGEVTRRWRDDAAAPAPAIPQTAASTSLPSRPTSAAAGPPPTHIDVQLDPHLAVRFVPPNATNRQPPRLELYMCCDGVRQRLVCGRNVPGELGWDPPPSRPPGAGGSSTSGTASPYDSEPPTPGGSSAQRPPAIGEESNVSQLPPPAFLRNLARQGGAGTHRSGGVAPGRTSGPAGAGTMGAGSNSNGSGSAVGDQAVGFSSITASLAALTEGLQVGAWGPAKKREEMFVIVCGMSVCPHGVRCLCKELCLRAACCLTTMHNTAEMR